MRAPPRPFRVVVVGAGFAGTLTAVELLRAGAGGAPLEVTLLERSGDFGPGVAFSTPDPQHLLNVTAAGMSALAHEPTDFLTWLRARDEQATTATFAPRMLYGAYLRELLDGAARNPAPGATLVRRADEAMRIVQDDPAAPAPALVETAGGARLLADAVVLAVGVNRPRTPPGAAPELAAHPGYVEDPWDHERIAALADRGRVLIVGSGLTMIDVAMTVSGDRAGVSRDGAGEHGPQLTAISRRGVLPRSHRAGLPPAVTQPYRPPSGPLTADRLAASVETAALAEQAAGGDWRTAVDGVRPYTQQLWQALPLGEQARFLARHARRWEIHRHRMAPAVGARIDGLRRDGRLELRAGSIQRIDPDGSGGEIHVRVKSPEGPVHRLAFDAVVNCTGPDPAPGADGDRLLSSLIEDRLGRAGPLGLGLDTGADGELCDCDGRRSSHLFTLGALRRGQLWETTAVPEIRCQAADLAALLAGRAAAAVGAVVADAADAAA